MPEKATLLQHLIALGTSLVKDMENPADVSNFADKFSATCTETFPDVVTKNDAARMSDVIWSCSSTSFG